MKWTVVQQVSDFHFLGDRLSRVCLHQVCASGPCARCGSAHGLPRDGLSVKGNAKQRLAHREPGNRTRTGLRELWSAAFEARKRTVGLPRVHIRVHVVCE